MKKLISAVLILAIVLGLAACSGGNNTAPAADPVAAYRLEKLNEVNDMVLERKVVPEDYLRYLPEELGEAVKQYNVDTSALKSNYSRYAEGTVASLFYSFDPPPSDPGGYLRPDRYYQTVDRMSTLALYHNSRELFYADSVLSYPAAHEGGGSYGLWAEAIHEAWYVGQELAQQAEEYFTMTDALLTQMEAARAAFG